MRRNSFLGMGMATLALMASGLGGQMINLMPTEKLAILPLTQAVSKPPKRRKRSTRHKANGKREVERRLRQIAAGQLTRANGLVTGEELYGRARAA